MPKGRVFATKANAPAGFPAGVALFKQSFVNWARDIVVDDLWTCAPTTGAQVVAVTNWAHAHGYRVRARGSMHGWSPLAIPNGANADVLMVDTTRMNWITTGTRDGHGTVTFGTGALLQDVMEKIERHGWGFVATPAPGDITMGGALAIDGHGTSIPARGEKRLPGQTFGSLSNLVTSLTVVAWNQAASAYELRVIDRSHPDAKAVLTHVGRAFVVEATMQVAPNARLRCLSRTDLTIDELFAAPGSAKNTFASFVEGAGRVEIIWYAFTDKPWLKVWSVAPVKPKSSREVTSPNNYPFSDNIPTQLSDLTHRMITGEPQIAPLVGQVSYAVSAGGLAATNASDIWGWSRNVLLYIKPTTMRVTANGYAFITRRADIQRVVHEFTEHYIALRDTYRARGEYPANMPIELRVTGLDDPSDSIVAGAEAPTLSAVSPDPAHPDRDVAVWFDVLTFPGTPQALPFFRELERWIYEHFSSYCTVRVEWSKGWAYTNNGGWSNDDVIGKKIPASLTEGRPPAATFAAAAGRLRALDPHGVFQSPLTRRLLG